MPTENTVPNNTFNANHLLDGLNKMLSAKNDASLSRMLEVAPPIISKVRHGKLPISAALLIRMHEVSGMNVKELQALMGDRRQKFRLSSVQGKPA